MSGEVSEGRSERLDVLLGRVGLQVGYVDPAELRVLTAQEEGAVRHVMKFSTGRELENQHGSISFSVDTHPLTVEAEKAT